MHGAEGQDPRSPEVVRAIASDDGPAALDAILARAAGEESWDWARELAVALAGSGAPVRNVAARWTQWLLRVLAVARGAPLALAEVPGDATPIRGLEGPLVVVAGDGRPEPGSEFASRWEGILGEAFAGFRGTVVSGGTTTGVPGIVGRAVRPACARCRLVGYLPGGFVERRDERHSPDYDEIRTTSGDRFSPLEPLATWRDVLASGLRPESVRVLGIGGGRVSGFEYRLAGLLGACVGLVRGSGRAADETLEAVAAQGTRSPSRLAPGAEAIAAFLRPSV